MQTFYMAAKKKKPFIQIRLDYCLISDTYQEEVEKADIIPSINSDHSVACVQTSPISFVALGKVVFFSVSFV